MTASQELVHLCRRASDHVLPTCAHGSVDATVSPRPLEEQDSSPRPSCASKPEDGRLWPPRAAAALTPPKKGSVR